MSFVLGVGPLCFIKSRVNTALYREILGHVMLLSADKLLIDLSLAFFKNRAVSRVMLRPRALVSL